jgi:hypothetical protein
MSSSLEVEAINARLLAPSAAELVVMVENGNTDAALARIQTLSQRDFIQVQRAIQVVEKALGNYAQSWRNACDWGNGTPYPDES